ncbi:RT0821/Lpp0805 family surface protein [Rhizobium oryzicola]|uniref:RT0821/Lpp0805 family surface protein n=1 Tax=Rhizobium oryzicola TaxID=1232668 RepID=A0ABT8SSA9_9HYPH|nr:RT0821/Lpp0805 family surface protein [Rhizobium oryzicola]MDO1581289.1 RT0821/Lpp0805 family surface protein [Rhizobium oryzicola]
MLSVCSGLAGCTSGSFDLFDSSPKVDRTLSTGSVPKRPTETASDEVTVRNAVTSADLQKLGTSPLPWANTTTGSAGVVSQIHEVVVSGQKCRFFTTTRHAYDGIARFSGQACYVGGDWTLTSFDRQ